MSTLGRNVNNSDYEAADFKGFTQAGEALKSTAIVYRLIIFSFILIYEMVRYTARIPC